MSITTNTVLEAANHAYAEGQLQIDQDLPVGSRGDLLADFIANEIREVTKGMEGHDAQLAISQAASEAIESAIERLQEVHGAISAVEESPARPNYVDVAILFNHVQENGESVYKWTSPEGRAFEVHELNQETYFLIELIPNGNHLSSSGELLTEHRYRILSMVETMRPSEFYSSLPEGVTTERLVRSGGGHRVGSLYYVTLNDAKRKIREALAEDVWYQSWDPDLVIRISEEEYQSGKQAKDTLDFWQEKLNMLTRKPEGQSESFRGFGDMFGDFGDETRSILLSFYNNPCSETWDAVAHRILIGGSKTGWQIWVECDFHAPRGKSSEQWDVWPDPEKFREHIHETLDAEITRARRKIHAAQNELRALGVQNA